MMDLTTTPAPTHAWRGENSLLALPYFPSECHRTFGIEVTHGAKYDKNCNSCQVGVTYIKQAFEYLNEGNIIWNQTITAQTADSVSVKVGDYRRDFNLKTQKVCVVPVEPLIENLLDWFCKQFKGQLELAHVNRITMQTENVFVYRDLGY